MDNKIVILLSLLVFESLAQKNLTYYTISYGAAADNCDEVVQKRVYTVPECIFKGGNTYWKYDCTNDGTTPAYYICTGTCSSPSSTCVLQPATSGCVDGVKVTCDKEVTGISVNYVLQASFVSVGCPEEDPWTRFYFPANTCRSDSGSFYQYTCSNNATILASICSDSSCSTCNTNVNYTVGTCYTANRYSCGVGVPLDQPSFASALAPVAILVTLFCTLLYQNV